ncbi:class I tRNA ligase family protein, partial [Candidatus Woesearchaeota archaeon]|nr:class I tRNA ligase family protein [Candidatus Woesearchaeota archaeon]
KMQHVLNVHERCGIPIEYVALEQWFIKYLDLKPELLRRGKQLNWYPKHMINRYENWIKGLQWDWCISRQRFSGVPFPVWYDKKTGEPIFADEKQLPVDPLKDLPKGYKRAEVIAEKDILDTWATSSLTPHLAADLFKDHPVYKKLLPMNLRPQAHDIITFWLFNTVVRSNFHDNDIPWKDVMISGWALDPHGRKMSKSKGNVVEPQVMMEKYGADALRFWAAGSKLGDDLPFQEKDLVTGHKFATKLWNASKFSLMHLEKYKGEKPKKIEKIDSWILNKLNKIIKVSTESFDKYEYNKTKLETEKFFWHDFADNYLEIIKDRLYNPEKYSKENILSAKYTLYTTILTCLKLIAPIMPFISEEIYNLYFNKIDGSKSIHTSRWPEFDKGLVNKKDEEMGDVFVMIVGAVRKFKSEKNLALREPIKVLTIETKHEKSVKDMTKDLIGVTKAENIEFGKGNIEVSEELKISIDL